MNSWLAWLGFIAVTVASMLGLLAWRRSRLANERAPEPYPYGNPREAEQRRPVGASPYETLLVVATISPFVTAFATSLGARLGTSVEVRRRPRRQRGEANNLVLTHRARVTTIEVGTELSDEARLALIDLDLTRPELRGHLLRWSEEAAAWLPVPVAPASEGAS